MVGFHLYVLVIFFILPLIILLIGIGLCLLVIGSKLGTHVLLRINFPMRKRGDTFLVEAPPHIVSLHKEP